MNKTKIEWCDDTWNPVTGCLHGCEYCYARTIASRFGAFDVPDWSDLYRDTGLHELNDKIMTACKDGKDRICAYPYGFVPTFYRYRLDEPAQKTRPRTIFVCSMADLFGDWVPNEWIEAVIEACKSAPQHRYLFLTKNPTRYAQLVRAGILPSGDQYWYGATFDHSNWSDKKGGHDPGDFYFPEMHGRNTFVSFEPLLRDFNIGGMGTRWIIIGAQTGNQKNKITPKPEWIQHLVEFSDKNGIAVFMKDSLIPIMGEANMRREFPWRTRL